MTATHGHGEGMCADCGKPLAPIRYRFGHVLTCQRCATFRMKAGERCHA